VEKYYNNFPLYYKMEVNNTFNEPWNNYKLVFVFIAGAIVNLFIQVLASYKQINFLVYYYNTYMKNFCPELSQVNETVKLTIFGCLIAGTISVVIVSLANYLMHKFYVKYIVGEKV
jgi:hypothetical protein